MDSSASVSSSPEVTRSPSPNVPDEHSCHLCNERLKQPRVLKCLHVFCAECLEKQVETETIPGGLSEIVTLSLLQCPICKQETKLGDKGVSDLPQDYVMINMLDMSAIQEMQIICTSCKAKEKAVARCSDCANFLCPNCVTAHQYMRCFENHKVVSFEELRSADGLTIHKPLFCAEHPSESMKFYCNVCQIPICNECVVNEHKQPEHQTERISDIETQELEELQTLMTEAKEKVTFCEQASTRLDSALSDLQMQHDNAQGLIEETFQSYRALLEKRKNDMLKELDGIHSSKELSIMDLFHEVEKATEKIEDACKFAERVVKNGNSVEVLLLKKRMTSQLLCLINNTPNPDVDITIEFSSDQDRFEDGIKETFGIFKKKQEQKEVKETPVGSLHSSFENEGIALPPGILSPDTSVMPPSVPTSDFISHMPPLTLPNITSTSITEVSAQTINSIASSLQNLNTVGVSGAAERSHSRNSYSPAMSDSGISVDAASSGSSTCNQPFVNFAALAKIGSALDKLGTVNMNSQGQFTVNGQVIPGLNVGSVGSVGSTGTTMPRSLTSRGPTTPTPDSPLTNMTNILNNVGQTRNCPTPQLDDLASLLTPPTPQLNGMAPFGGATSTASIMHQPILPMSMNGPGLAPMPPPPTPSYNPNPHPPFPVRNSSKMSAMQIRCKFGQLGPGKGQFNSPHGFCLGLEEDIIVADTNNHRIQVFEKTGEFKYQFGIPGRDEGQLWYPRKVAVLRHSGKYVVCDRGNERSRMQIFTKSGHFIKKIAIRYIDIVAGLAVTPQGHIVAVDSVSPTVFCIAETGDLIKWFDCSDYMREPSDIAVSGKEYFVCDFKGHCVVVFNEEGQFARRIGCENITNYPNGIDISDAGDVLIGDSHGNRFHVAVFQRDGSLIGEFECPYVKVSRCCGLKLTSEGYIVTLAKNNHHVLVLNTLYIA